jgi:addiction module HigA family antidote
MTRKLKPVSPGEMLVEEFLKPLGMSTYRLAKEIGVPAQRIGEIVAGKRAITADTDLRLCRFFGLSDGWWLRLQADYDTEVAKASLAKTLAKIRPWKEAAEQTRMRTDLLLSSGSVVTVKEMSQRLDATTT